MGQGAEQESKWQTLGAALPDDTSIPALLPETW